jgi:16S rRNA (adenine1518-N6/adenine1519-N6)-dimethyltransferase
MTGRPFWCAPEPVAHAKKSLGQNFLIDANIQRKIVAALEAGPEDEVLEIGPGRGALTRHLAGRVGRLVVVELDDALAAALAAELGGAVEVIHGDALDVRLTAVSALPERLKVVGNIPYNITTPLLFHLLEGPERPERIVVMIQREVADRILAPPGAKAYGALSVGIRTVAEVDRLFAVGRNAFRPVPDVESMVIRIRPFRQPLLDGGAERDLRALTRTAFGWRRKQLQKILRSAPEYALGSEEVSTVAEGTGIDLRLRPESLTPEEFIGLAAALRELGRPRAGGAGP